MIAQSPVHLIKMSVQGRTKTPVVPAYALDEAVRLSLDGTTVCIAWRSSAFAYVVKGVVDTMGVNYNREHSLRGFPLDVCNMLRSIARLRNAQRRDAAMERKSHIEDCVDTYPGVSAPLNATPLELAQMLANTRERDIASRFFD